MEFRTLVEKLGQNRNLHVVLRVSGIRDGEVSHQLRTLVTLAEIQVQFPAATSWFTTTCNSRSRGPDGLFWPL